MIGILPYTGELAMPNRPYKISVGQPFGRLTVLIETDPIVFKSGTKRRFLCRCECGSDPKPYTAQLLTSGKTRSCGCLQVELTVQRHTTHGHSPVSGKTVEYTTWKQIRGRCENDSNPGYPKYGGRGIKVCAGWHDFQSFLEDMGIKPDKSLSIDRINNNGHYSCGHCDECLHNGWPANCRWATKDQQSNNTRANRKITFAGRTMNLSQWSLEVGINDDTISSRLKKGWTVERALTEPVPPRRKRKRRGRPESAQE